MKIYNQKIYLNKTVYFNVGPRSPTIHIPQGIRWPQFLNCSLLDLCLSANWAAPPTIHRGLEWPKFLNCFLSVCLFVIWLFSKNFLIFLCSIRPLGFVKTLWECIRCEFISLHPALHRNGGWPAPPGVTSERRLEGLCIHFLICCLLSVCNIFTTPRAGP